MRVRAYDGIGPAGYEPSGELFLLGVVEMFILDAPVREYQHQVGMGAGALHDEAESFLVLVIHFGPAGVRVHVCPVGAAYKGYFYAFHEQDRGVDQRVGGGIGGYSRVGDVHPFQSADGAAQTLRPSVQYMVVGREQQVEADPGKIFRITVRTGESRIAGIRLARKGELHVADGHIGPFNPVLDVFEESVVAVQFCALPDGAVAHDVANEKQLQRV